MGSSGKKLSSGAKTLGSNPLKFARDQVSATDPIDITGAKQKKRDQDTESMISDQNAQVEAFMAKRPKYASMQDKNGKLNSKYQVKGPEDAKAYDVQIAGKGGLDARQASAKNVGVDDVKYGGDVNTGKNFNAAQGNINALQSRAFGTDTSPWAQKLYDQQALQQSGALDQASADSRASYNQAANDMAMQGGLEGGSRERLARAGAKDSLTARQGVFRQGQEDKLGIGINDEAQRMQLQQQMPGMNMQMDQYKTGLQQGNRDSRQQLGLANQQTNLNEQQFNANLNMQKVNNWQGAASQNAQQRSNASQFNAGQQNQVNAINQNTLIGNVMGKNAYGLEAWQTQGSMLGNTQTANMQARQSSNKGGFFQNTLGLG